MRSTRAQPRNIDVADVPTLAQDFTHHQHALNRVNVAVDPDCLRCQLPRWCGDLF
jgi:hypothetical protein